MAHRDYRSETLTVHWDSELCIHSGHCVQSLRAVFDNKRRPWIWVDGADDEAIRETVEGCPSRALTYTMHTESAAEESTDQESGQGSVGDESTESTAGAAAGGAAQDDQETAGPVPGVTVRPHENGPLEVVGEVALLAPDGSEVRRSSTVFLCRCGHSRSKPFCDGSHERFGFRDPGLSSE